MRVKIAPSIISADFSQLIEETKRVEEAGADLLHIDVYPLVAWGLVYPTLRNFTLGALIMEVLRDKTKLPFDVHLAIEVSDKLVAKYAQLKSDIITVPVEACVNLRRTLKLIKKWNMKAGVALNPSTPLSMVYPYINDVNVILLMTVNIHYGGQDLLPKIVPKIRKARQLVNKQHLDVDISVDCGINTQTAPLVVKAGANILIAGRAIYGQKDYKKAIEALRSCV